MFAREDSAVRLVLPILSWQNWQALQCGNVHALMDNLTRASPTALVNVNKQNGRSDVVHVMMMRGREIQCRCCCRREFLVGISGCHARRKEKVEIETQGDCNYNHHYILTLKCYSHDIIM